MSSLSCHNVHIFVHVQFLFRNEQYTNFATELEWKNNELGVEYNRGKHR